MESGGEKKNHKWYARIGSPGNYKYFYSQQEVDAYKAKMSGGSTKATAKSSNDSKGSSTKSSSGTKATNPKEQKPNIASVSDTVNNVAKVAGKDKSEVNKVMSLVASKGWDSPEVAAAVKNLANNNEELGKKMLLHLRVAKTYEDGLNAKKKKTKDKLQHSGIMGMKWGVRRWQYEDGSLTPAGYEHYGVKKARKIDAKHYTKELNKRSKKGKDSTALIKKLEDKGFDVNSRIKVSSYNREKARKKAAVAATTAVSAIGTLAAGPAVGIPAGVAAGIGTMAVTSRKPYTKYKVKANDKKMDQKEYYNNLKDNLKESKSQLLKKAKEKDSWDMNFLEMVDDETLGDTKKLYKGYEQWLTDPEKWEKNRYK